VINHLARGVAGGDLDTPWTDPILTYIRLGDGREVRGGFRSSHMERATLTGSRRRWSDLCQDPGYRGRWVALQQVRYESGVPTEGEVVDVDDDLATLCVRVQSADRVACAILFCDDKASGIRRAVS